MKNIFKKIIIYIIEIEARVILRRYKPKIVAITGNVGKTSTKDAIYTVLSPSFHVRKSQKSFNSEIGVPLTIIGCPSGWSNPFIWIRNIIKGLFVIIFYKNYPECLVLEVGADKPGDIKRIANWLSADIVVFTYFGNIPVHIEFFDSKEQLFEEKMNLVKALKDTGTLIFNKDSEELNKLTSEANNKPITYGFSEISNIMASNYEVEYEEDMFPLGFSFKVNFEGNCIPFNLKGVLGKQHAYPLLAAVAVGISKEINLINIKNSLSEHIPPPGRMNILKGINKSIIIDDSYNASPVAMNSALLELENLKCKGRKMVILGDMMELGKHTHEEHKNVGNFSCSFADIIITVGTRSRAIYDIAQENGVESYHFSDSVSAGQKAEEIVKEGDIVLVKGSQSSRMEKVSYILLSNKEESEKVLVRQDGYWKKI